VCYTTDRFLVSQRRLVESARVCGIERVSAWDRSALEQTPFYATHRAVLDRSRGAGYWLWKPFIIHQALEHAAPDEIAVYADAGIEIVGGLAPLVSVCRRQGGVLLFAGHYDDVGSPGPNVCGKWTKRDCFVLTNCDEPRYYECRMLDASFIVLAKTERALTLVAEWLRWCTDPRLLTDEPNVCGRENLPAFIDRRHDQSILSLLAARDAIELFRHPSQHGNHLKMMDWQESGEWRRAPYDPTRVYRNSPYGTLLNHHRGRGDRDQRTSR